MNKEINEEIGNKCYKNFIACSLHLAGLEGRQITFLWTVTRFVGHSMINELKFKLNVFQFNQKPTIKYYHFVMKFRIAH